MPTWISSSTSPSTTLIVVAPQVLPLSSRLIRKSSRPTGRCRGGRHEAGTTGPEASDGSFWIFFLFVFSFSSSGPPSAVDAAGAGVVAGPARPSVHAGAACRGASAHRRRHGARRRGRPHRHHDGVAAPLGRGGHGGRDDAAGRPSRRGPGDPHRKPTAAHVGAVQR